MSLLAEPVSLVPNWSSASKAKGHEVIAASPASGVNAFSGEGLAEVLVGAQVVVDVANSPSFEDKAVMEFFQTSGAQSSDC